MSTNTENSGHAERDLFSRTQAFKTAYAPLVDIVCNALERVDIHDSLGYSSGRTSKTLREGFDAVTDAIHPRELTYEISAEPLIRRLRDMKDALYSEARRRGEKIGPLSEEGRAVIDGYVAMEKVVMGFGKEYPTLAGDIRAYRATLDFHRTEVASEDAAKNRADNDSRFASRLGESRQRVESGTSASSRKR